MWIKEFKGNAKFNFIAGMELTKIDPDDKWILLDHAYGDWYRKEKEKVNKDKGQ